MSEVIGIVSPEDTAFGAQNEPDRGESVLKDQGISSTPSGNTNALATDLPSKNDVDGPVFAGIAGLVDEAVENQLANREGDTIDSGELSGTLLSGSLPVLNGAAALRHYGFSVARALHDSQLAND